MVPATTATTEALSMRRFANNYRPTLWGHDFIQTLKNDYKAEPYVRRASTLKDQVKHLLDHLYEEKGSMELLALVDDIQRLGLGYIFEQDIHNVFKVLEETGVKMGGSLAETAIYFRLFRQHGFSVSQDVFKVFHDPEGSFSEHLGQDIKGLLNLLEASYLGMEGEDIMDQAHIFAYTNLCHVNKGSNDPNLVDLVVRALGLPLHHKLPRVEARWYIDAYSKRVDANLTLLEHAKLNFNLVQSVYQEELISLSKWWNNLRITEKLPFTRDRLVESFMWGVGMINEIEDIYSRPGITKFIALVTVMDDLYDVYATYEEAQLFTEAVERWDVNQVEQLPDYMKLTFLAVYNTTNEFAYETLKSQGLNILPFLRSQWATLVRSYLLELKWFKTGYKPTLSQYLENACISSVVPLLCAFAYVFMTPKISQDALDCIDNNPGVVRWSNLILRLLDDFRTSKDELERGDVPKSIQCYMNDAGVTEDVARKYISHLTKNAWKKLNAELVADSPLPKAFADMTLGFARMGEMFYQFGDGFGRPDLKSKASILSLVVDNIPV